MFSYAPFQGINKSVSVYYLYLHFISILRIVREVYKLFIQNIKLYFRMFDIMILRYRRGLDDEEYRTVISGVGVYRSSFV